MQLPSKTSCTPVAWANPGTPRAREAQQEPFVNQQRPAAKPPWPVLPSRLSAGHEWQWVRGKPILARGWTAIRESRSSPAGGCWPRPGQREQNPKLPCHPLQPAAPGPSTPGGRGHHISPALFMPILSHLGQGAPPPNQAGQTVPPLWFSCPWTRVHTGPSPSLTACGPNPAVVPSLQ